MTAHDMTGSQARELVLKIDEFYLDLQHDGKAIVKLDQESIEQCPFPGLRPFRTSEFTLFKGREHQVEAVLKKLHKENFLAVIGSSGTGKSSLIRAGLIPDLFGGFLKRGGTEWDIAICRPGDDPINNLAVSFAYLKGESRDPNIITAEYQLFHPLLTKSSYGILNAANLLREGEKQKHKSLLIIIDQFEELFRYDQEQTAQGSVESQFIKLLLQAASADEQNIYVIITMRSEFLGNTVKYKGLPEAINAGQYLVPQLNTEDLEDVIVEPVARAKKSIDSALAQLLINEIQEKLPGDENLDYLPLMQHALMRTYEYAVSGLGKNIVELQDYQAVGEMKHALAIHAESIFLSLNNEAARCDKQDVRGQLEIVGHIDRLTEIGDEKSLPQRQKIAKILFQALTDGSTDLKGGRRPTSIGDIYKIAAAIGAQEDEVNEVIEFFRCEKTSFITPAPNISLSAQLKLDISHESLMRHWPRLKKWMADEVRNAKLYRTLNDRRELYEAGKESWIDGGLLEDMVDWMAHFPHSPTWAKRYHINDQSTISGEEAYKRNLDYLRDSIAKEKEAKKLALNRIASKKVNRIAKWATAVVIFVILMSLLYQVQLSNIAFSIAAIDKIDAVADKKMSCKILITAREYFAASTNDSLITAGLNSSRDKLISVFNENGLASTAVLSSIGFRPVSAYAFNNDRLIAVNYQQLKKTKNEQGNIISPSVKSNASNYYGGINVATTDPGFTKPDQSVVYDKNGALVAMWHFPVAPVDHADLICGIDGKQLEVIRNKSVLNRIPLNRFGARFLSARYDGTKKNEHLLVNWSADSVELFDLARHNVPIVYTSAVFTGKKSAKPLGTKQTITGQFLTDGRLVIVNTESQQDGSYLNIFPYTNKNSIAIYSDIEGYGKAQLFRNADNISISPSRTSLIILKNDTARLLVDMKLDIIEDKLTHKRILYDQQGNFLIFNESNIHVYDSLGKCIDKLTYQTSDFNEVWDFENGWLLTSAGQPTDYTSGKESQYLVKVFNLKTHKVISTRQLALLDCFLSNNADTLTVDSKQSGQNNVPITERKIYKIKMDLQLQQISSFSKKTGFGLTLDQSRYHPLATDHYNATNFFDAIKPQVPIDDYVINIQSGDVSLFNIEQLNNLDCDDLKSVIAYFNSRYPSKGSDERKAIDKYLHVNNSIFTRAGRRIFKLLRMN